MSSPEARCDGKECEKDETGPVRVPHGVLISFFPGSHPGFGSRGVHGACRLRSRPQIALEVAGALAVERGFPSRFEPNCFLRYCRFLDNTIYYCAYFRGSFRQPKQLSRRVLRTFTSRTRGRHAFCNGCGVMSERGNSHD